MTTERQTHKRNIKIIAASIVFLLTLSILGAAEARERESNLGSLFGGSAYAGVTSCGYPANSGTDGVDVTAIQYCCRCERASSFNALNTFAKNSSQSIFDICATWEGCERYPVNSVSAEDLNSGNTGGPGSGDGGGDPGGGTDPGDGGTDPGDGGTDPGDGGGGDPGGGTDPGDGGTADPDDTSQTGPGDYSQLANLDGFELVISRWYTVLFYLALILGIFMVVYGGFMYSIAAGNASKIEDAKSNILDAVIGVAIVLLAGAILVFLRGPGVFIFQ